jgi:hypothetical protein
MEYYGDVEHIHSICSTNVIRYIFALLSPANNISMHLNIAGSRVSVASY